MAKFAPEHIQKVQSLLDGLSTVEVAARCIQALRQWRSKNPTSSRFDMHGGLGLELIHAFAREGKPRPHDLKEIFLHEQHHPALRDVLDFVWWLVRSGLAVPGPIEPECKYPVGFDLTRAGAAFLDAQDDEHPLLPGWPARVRSRCPDLPDGVVALLVDARACMDHSLFRPAVVLMGVAYEVAIEEVVDHLVVKGHLTDKVRKDLAKVRIEKVVSVIDKVVSDADERTTAHAAYAFAELLRRRRNDAAHTRPRYGFEDRPEVEEFIVSAARYLPGVWSLVIP